MSDNGAEAFLAIVLIAALAVSVGRSGDSSSSISITRDSGSSSLPRTGSSSSGTGTGGVLAVSPVPGCTNVSEVGAKSVVRDGGIEAFTIRQYVGTCTDAKGTDIMGFASVYVWRQFHDKGTTYQAVAGLDVTAGQSAQGIVTGPSRQRLVYSTPVRVGSGCTAGWGKIVRNGASGAAASSPRLC